MKQRVVVAGSGFAGLGVARQLQADFDVTVVTPSGRFVYLPLIHEIVGESVEAPEVTRPLEDILRDVRIVIGKAASVEGKELVTSRGERIPFDKLVVAVGAEPNDFGVPGVKEHSFTFTSAGDALRANAALKVASANAADAFRAARIIIVGAGYTGVEVAAEAAVLLDRLGSEREVIVLDALPEIFPRQSEDFREGIREGLERLDIELRTSQRIVEVRKDGVVVQEKDGGTRFVEGDAVFWCAGSKPRAIEGVDPNVRPTLQSVGRDDVFVLGDAARFPREMGVPPLAQTAEQQADLAAHNIAKPGSMREYKPSIKGVIVSVGPGYAVAELNRGPVMRGKVPWTVKRSLYKAKIALA